MRRKANPNHFVSSDFICKELVINRWKSAENIFYGGYKRNLKGSLDMIQHEGSISKNPEDISQDTQILLHNEEKG